MNFFVFLDPMDGTGNEDYILTSMINIFRSMVLRKLLKAFGRSTAGKKYELKKRAIDILKNKPADVDYHSFTAKIREMYSDLQVDKSTDIKTPEQRKKMSRLNWFLDKSNKESRKIAEQFIDNGTRSLTTSPLPFYEMIRPMIISVTFASLGDTEKTSIEKSKMKALKSSKYRTL